MTECVSDYDWNMFGPASCVWGPGATDQLVDGFASSVVGCKACGRVFIRLLIRLYRFISEALDFGVRSQASQAKFGSI